MKIVYMGTPDFAVEPLRLLVENGYNIAAVVTMPDKPAGRGLKLTESPVKRYAQSVGLTVLQPEKLKNEAFIEELRSINADLFIVVAFRMLPEIVWNMPPLGTFNLHASLLPHYRGAAPINRAIINGETKTGVTTFFLKHEIDTGDVIFQQEVPILPEDNAGDLHDKLMETGAQLVLQTVKMVEQGKVNLVSQSSLKAEQTLKDAPKLTKETCLIDWLKPGKEIVNLIRGLSPYPTAYCVLEHKGEDLPLKVFSARFEELKHNEPIASISSDEKTYLKVACGNGFILLEDIQLAGKKRMRVDEFLRGFRLQGVTIKK